MRTILAAVSALGLAAGAMAQTPPPVLGLKTQAEPYATASVVNHPKTIGWPDGRKPVAPRGYEVIKFAGGLDYPRQALLLPNGDMLVAEARTKPKLDAEPDVQRGQALSKTTGFSANRITLLRDANRDGVAEQRFVLIEGLNQPFGMQYANGRLYVANTDGVVSVPFSPGQTRVTATPQPLVSLPAGGYNNHWTRNLLLSPDARTLYVSVGSASNVGEHGMDEEKRRAAILAIDLRTGRERLYASGLRNPVGMAWAPGTNTLWAAVNERDQLGDDIAPDYLVGVRDGGFYGWPYSYYGKQDPRHANTKRELLATTLLPDVAVGPHAAALGVAFAKGTSAAQQVAYVARHGSWNRSAFIGYDVLAVPFANGKPTAAPQPFLTGFVANEKTGEVYGRPVSVQTRDDGAIFVVDDAGDTVWLVRRTA
ncbi:MULTISPECIES: PQQ-dependent sugar dehydrogenase [unclassified Sphingomonas]|uniref:PQQ-dependent sugar dehydrogenase n=1 Tax=unclassified Sphingomonas TaxID=196159 RepID=UPI0006FDFC38|nr:MULTISPECIES: sorbosone dehydrogenase family protein [unclassified Sphingomonas]KQN22253.1 L-sorbosone dehydrogenase [Sphingomonas sp. Leaf30]MBD8549516.1 sorbosone dehydrogenase family protein [Sphingomonas sp. CFBP 8764]